MAIKLCVPLSMVLVLFHCFSLYINLEDFYKLLSLKYVYFPLSNLTSNNVPNNKQL